jgi:hypothetical protein
MKHKLHQLMKKKADKGEVLSENHAKAKSGILEDLIGEMMDMEGDKVKNLKKVTVASDSPEGLEKGLDKAKEIVGNKDLAPEMMSEEMPEMASEEEESEEEEAPEMEASEEESEEEGEEKKVADLEEEIKKLKEKLAKHNLA